ncbi:MAG: glycosyltransferase family 9 protein [Flavobacteriales bacterium]|nr:glycosyltransferase family 9 protein [Flavobacteriales bacterium]
MTFKPFSITLLDKVLLKNILVIQTAFIGDAILASAALEALHGTFPDAKIDFLVRKGNESLYANHPFLNEVLVWDKKAGKYKQLLNCLRRIRKERYDLVVNFQRFASSGFLTAFSKGKIKHGFSKNPWSFAFTKALPHELGEKGDATYIHEIDRNHSLIEEWCGPREIGPKLYPHGLSSEIKLDEEFIVIAPSSVWFTKQYPAEKWIGFLDEMTAIQVVVIGAPSDAPLGEELIERSKHTNVVNLAGKLSLLESAALMSKAKMSYVNDSAPLHLASAVDTPVTAIFCSTIPEFGFGPSGTKGIIVQSELPLECRPCGLHGKKVCPLGHFDCAHSITPSKLKSVLH